MKTITGVMTVDSPEETTAKVAQLRAQGLLPQRGKAAEFVAKQEGRTVVSSYSSGIGDRLKAEFDRMGIKTRKGCSCTAVQRLLNSLTADKAREQLETILPRIIANVEYLEGLLGFAVKATTAVIPALAKRRVRKILLKCITEAERSISDPQEPLAALPSAEPETPLLLLTHVALPDGPEPAP